MKKILSTLFLLLMVCSFSFAAKKTKKEKQLAHSVKKEIVRNYFSYHVLTFNETCCDGTTRTSYIVWADGEEGSTYIPDPNGDCPLCPPS